MKGAMKATKGAEGAFGPLMKLITNMKFFAPILKPLNALLKVLMVSIFKPLMPLFIIIGKQLMGLMPLIEQLGAAIGEGLAEMLEAFMPIITVVIEELLPPLIEILIELIPLFMEFNPLLKDLVPIIVYLVEGLVILVGWLKAFVGILFGESPGLIPAFEILWVVVKNLIDLFYNNLFVAFDAYMEIMNTIVDFFNDTFLDAWDSFNKMGADSVDVLEDLYDVLEDFASLSFLGGGGGGGGDGGGNKCDDPVYWVTHPECWGKAAMGAYVPASIGGTPIIAGEGGVDELIVPVDQIGSIGGGGHEIHIHLEGAIINDEYSIDALVRKLRPLLFEVLD